MEVLNGGLENVPGYKFSAIKCGIRYKNRLDYCLIASDKPCNASGMFTTNKIFAAPIKLCRERIKNPVQALLINATNANACTGETGYLNAIALTDALASRLNIKNNTVLMASTGIIGHQLPVEKMRDGITELTGSLSQKNGALIPKAIMTTDTFPKSVAVSFKTSIGEFRIAGTAKGSGMIAPNMATLLAFIITDCPVERKMLDLLFRKHIGKSLNSITIDGDMSTNDTAIILSPAEKESIKKDKDIRNFEQALEHVLNELSRMLVTDGEGATKYLTINVKNARNDAEAVMIARSVSESLLVKTAFFGRDPNWGRIACAAGYSGADVKEESLTISIEDIPLLKNGIPSEYNKNILNQYLAKREIEIFIDIGLGSGTARYITCDISHDYVKINSEYST